MSEVRQAIAAEASLSPISPKERMGRGIWELSGRLVLVGPTEHIVFNGTFEVSKFPVIDGRLVDFGQSEPWFDPDDLRRLTDLARDPQWCRDALQEAISLFGRWDNWKHKYDAELTAALVCCTWLQTIWSWRPCIFVTGHTNCGKTVLLQDTLQRLFGRLSLYTQKPSEAGLRQEVQNSAVAVIIDEFESDVHRQKILEMFRTSSRGGKILRGSAGGQKSVSYGMKHIPWCGAIETGLQKAADKNRFIILELNTVHKKKGDKRLTVPAPDKLEVLGMKLLAIAMRHWKLVRDLCVQVFEKGIANIDYRIIESYTLPCSLLGAVMGLDADATVELMGKMLEDRDLTSQGDGDEDKLLRDIFESIVRGEKGAVKTVSELLRRDNFDPDGDTLLEQVGIRRLKATASHSECILFIQEPIKRRLLQDSDWRYLQIEQILARIKGAKRLQARIGGHRPRGIAVPTSEVERIVGSSSADEDEDGKENQNSIF